MRQLLVNSLLGLTAAAAHALPRRSALALGRRLGDLTLAVSPRRRALTTRNLEQAFGPALSPAERRRISREVFRHFGEMLIESFLLPGMVRTGLHHYVTHDGWEHLAAATAPGRGAIVVTGHFGNWEVAALAQGARGIPMDVVGRDPDDPVLARRLAGLRALTGNRSISKRGAARAMLRSLQEGRTVGLVVDQNARGASGVFVDFFGRSASTTPAPAVLALRTGVPIVPLFSYPETTGHRVVYEPAVVIDRTGDTRADVQALTARITSLIEQRIRDRPDLWLWMHDRWRTRPEDEAGAADELDPSPASTRRTA